MTRLAGTILTALLTFAPPLAGQSGETPRDTTRKTDYSAPPDAPYTAENVTVPTPMGANDPWMKYFLDYDPLVTIRQLKTPVLILMGGTDQQVTPDQAPKLVAAFAAAGNPDVTARVFGQLNHLFIYDPSGFPMGYARLPRRTVEPEVVGAVVDWLVARLR